MSGPNLRLSVTALDSFVWFKSSDQEPAELMRRLRGEEPPSPEMARGRALHKALELVEPGEFIALKTDDYVFHVPGSIEVEIPEYREIKAEYPIEIDGLTVTLVGKVDAFKAKTIYDHKGMNRFEAEYLFDTYQWRWYLQIFKADLFVWYCYVLKECGFKEYEVTAFHRVTQYRYPALEADCLELLHEFLAFLNISKLRFPKDEVPLATLLKANA